MKFNYPQEYFLLNRVAMYLLASNDGGYIDVNFLNKDPGLKVNKFIEGLGDVNIAIRVKSEEIKGSILVCMNLVVESAESFDVPSAVVDSFTVEEMEKNGFSAEETLLYAFGLFKKRLSDGEWKELGEVFRKQLIDAICRANIDMCSVEYSRENLEEYARDGMLNYDGETSEFGCCDICVNTEWDFDVETGEKIEDNLSVSVSNTLSNKAYSIILLSKDDFLEWWDKDTPIPEKSKLLMACAASTFGYPAFKRWLEPVVEVVDSQNKVEWF